MTFQIGDEVLVTEADAHNHNLIVGSIGTVVEVVGNFYDVRGTSRNHGGEVDQLIAEEGLASPVEIRVEA